MIEMFPVTEQWLESAHEISEPWEIPKPAGSDIGVQLRPPSEVVATTPAITLFTPIESLVPTAVQSRVDEHDSDSIESPGMIGLSVKVFPPSAVERNVASLLPATYSLLAARPAHALIAVQSIVTKLPTCWGTGEIENEWPPS